MGLFKSLKEIVGIEEIEEVSEEEVTKAMDELNKRPSSFEFKRQNQAQEPKQAADRFEVPKAQKTYGLGGTNPFKLVVIEPSGFDECPKLVDNLKSRKPVIINLEKLDAEVARKMFDFLSGATYALNGNVQKVANNIFVFAPENVDIAGNMEQKGLDFLGSSKNLWR